MITQTALFRWILLLVGTLGLLGCSSSPGAKLQEVNPVRTYSARYDQVLQAIRGYALQEGITLDRFEQDYGTVIGHKEYSPDGEKGGGTDDRRKVMLMKLSVERQGAKQTALNASFSFGSAPANLPEDDEEILVASYSTLFQYLNNALKP